MGITKVYILGHQLPLSLSKACGINVLFLSSLLGWQSPTPLANKELLPGRDMEPVLPCWHNSHEAKDIIQGSSARSQHTTSFFFTPTRSVCRGEKEWLCQHRYQKICWGYQLLSQKMGMGAQHLFKFILSHFLLAVITLFYYFTLDFAYSFGSVYKQIILFSQERPSKLPLRRLCPS